MKVGEAIFHYPLVHYFKQYMKTHMNFIDLLILTKSKNLFRDLIINYASVYKLIDEDVFEYFTGQQSSNLD